MVDAKVTLLQADLSFMNIDREMQSEGLIKLTDAAYLIGGEELAEKYRTRIHTSVYRSKAIYQTIISLIDAGKSVDVAKQLTYISEPDFAAVATSLAALLDDSTEKQTIFMRRAQQLLPTIKDTEKRAVATSKVARYLYRLNKDMNAVYLFNQALDLAKQIPDTNHRNAAILMVALDKERVFIRNDTHQVINLIKDGSLKSSAMEIITSFQLAQTLL